MSRVQERGSQMMADHGFLGVPVETFDQGGRQQLIALLGEGMNPESKLIEFGCGRALRVTELPGVDSDSQLWLKIERATM